MKITLPYGGDTVSFEVPDRRFLRMYDPVEAPAAPDFEVEIRRAIDNPIGTPPLEQIVFPGAKINVIVDDGSRPTPVSKILPVLLGKLSEIGVSERQVRIIVALGSHRHMTPDELQERVGAGVVARYEVINSEFHDPKQLVYVGNTPDGVEIHATRAAMEADIRIGVGNLVPHPVMGWSGGGKILYPGVAGENTVSYFHLKGSLENGNLFGREDSPIRTMMEGWVDTIGLDFIVNTVLNSHMQLHGAVAGHYIQAHRAGVEIAKRVLGCAVDTRADVVVVSSFPADQDFWQSPKGMYSAEYALKGESGGTIILVSPNYEGVGPHPEYPEWMGRDDGDELVRGIFSGKPFDGDALAMAIGNSMSKMRRRRRLVVVSDGVTAEDMARCGCRHYPTAHLQQAVDDALAGDQNKTLAAVSNGAETFLYHT
ncbi:MAG: nickel-dependent lactate racemase [Clostridiaceae bacterium]